MPKCQFTVVNFTPLGEIEENKSTAMTTTLVAFRWRFREIVDIELQCVLG